MLGLRDSRQCSHLHLLCSGDVDLVTTAGRRLKVSEPSVPLLQRPPGHQLLGRPHAAPELISAEIDFGPSDENPLLRGLPDLMQVPLAQLQADAAALAPVRLGQSPTAWLMNESRGAA